MLDEIIIACKSLGASVNAKDTTWVRLNVETSELRNSVKEAMKAKGIWVSSHANDKFLVIDLCHPLNRH